VNSRLLVRRQKMRESQRCCHELAELTVDDIWQIATMNFGDWHTVVSEVPWSLMAKTTMDCHSKLVLHSLRSITPPSQCRSSCISRNRPRSYFRIPVTRRAAAFRTCCIVSMTLFVPEAFRNPAFRFRRFLRGLELGYKFSESGVRS